MTDGGPSATAHLVGRCVTLLHDDPVLGALVSREAAEAGWWFADEYRGRWARLIPRSWDRRITFALVDGLVPGIVTHYALRKRCIEDAARQSGAKRFIVLGGGFDTLAWRLAREDPSVRCVEIDHPATQAVKRRALVRHRAMPPNLALIPADFRRQRLDDLVREISDNNQTFVACEGVLMYLHETEATAVFDAVARHCGIGSQFAFTFMELGPEGVAWFPEARSLVSRWLRAVGEPFDWGITRAALPACLAEHGLTVREIATREILRERYLPSATVRIAAGEFVALAVRD